MKLNNPIDAWKDAAEKSDFQPPERPPQPPRPVPMPDFDFGELRRNAGAWFRARWLIAAALLALLLLAALVHGGSWAGMQNDVKWAFWAVGAALRFIVVFSGSCCGAFIRGILGR